ncbi:MAG TPA: BT_3928 family protein [Chitinophagaceae bacterium]|nr:BT_3928 family protein [Chitinophagaceae bacterium]
MKPVLHITRVLVGILFLFSGLVKANDPLGLSYKMQEFFDLWGMSSFHSWTLGLSIAVIGFEIIAGMALLTGWQMRLFSWLLLLLIVFFTFLTAYAHFSGKFKNCGCFGDCIPISTKTSFLKDLALLLLIGFLFAFRKQITPVFSNRVSAVLMGATFLVAFGMQWWTLNYLPVVDCLPFRKGNNIKEQMKIPANAIPDSTVITFVYEKDGKRVEFTADQFPADFSSDAYKFVSRYDKVVRKGKNNEPPIKGFILSGSTNTDSTEHVLSNEYSVLLFCETFSNPVSRWEKDFARVWRLAGEKGVPAYLITTQPEEAYRMLKSTEFARIQVLTCDYTAIRTAARANPTVYVLAAGTVLGKWSFREMQKAEKKLRPLVVKQARQRTVPADSLPMPVDSSKIR